MRCLFPIVALVVTVAAHALPCCVTVAAIQTEMRLYPTVDAFAAHMAQRTEAAMKTQPRPDLLVFPEDVGTPLAVLGDHDLVASSKTLKDALTAMIQRHGAEIEPICGKYQVSPLRALWLLKADAVRRAYIDTFSALARKHQVMIVAGSAPMTFPDSPGAVFNAACVFRPSGRMAVLSRKVNLVDLEPGLDLSAGTINDLRSFSLTPGSVRSSKAVIGCLICADGWHPELAKRLVDQRAQLLLQVSANAVPWSPEEQATWKQSLYTRAQELGVYGVCVMSVGHLLDVGFEGQSAIVAPKGWTKDGSGYVCQASSATKEEIVTATLTLREAGGASAPSGG